MQMPAGLRRHRSSGPFSKNARNQSILVHEIGTGPFDPAGLA